MMLLDVDMMTATAPCGYAGRFFVLSARAERNVMRGCVRPRVNPSAAA
jgi:hypothetical protein